MEGWNYMSDELFVDGVGEVVITGMVVRIDLVAFNTSDRNEQGRPKGEVRQRIVMPVDGFVRAVQTLGEGGGYKPLKFDLCISSRWHRCC